MKRSQKLMAKLTGRYIKILQLQLYILIVYREGDIVKEPMKKGSFVPKNVPGVGWGGVNG